MIHFGTPSVVDAGGRSFFDSVADTCAEVDNGAEVGVHETIEGE